jgi:hypothetical protein
MPFFGKLIVTSDPFSCHGDQPDFRSAYERRRA